ncbi:hypothetical protein CXB51_026997 [Gossypium anomalum]|uniref:SAP30-binding protein n=1 Tax=Gossypium anomalum TaxID=47600 RepID=A0A8J5YTJ3_9ROSI|nr:hypothetical protein CXB51_026997 [Gossypium anomalum]
MASRKKESEGIALLSMYNDEDDEEMGDIEEGDHRQNQQTGEEEEEQQEGQPLEEENEYRESNNNMEEDSRTNDNTPPFPHQNTNLSQQQQEPSVSSPQQPQPLVSSKRSGGGRLTIVDYGHDEAAMSPEPEEGELGSSDDLMIGIEQQNANDVTFKSDSFLICHLFAGDFQGKTPPAAVQLTPQSSDLEPLQPETLTNAVNESDGVEVEEAVSVDNVDPLDKFLPPPPKVKCSEELQRKIDKFLNLKRAGKSFNAEVRNRKDYRNPDFLLHAVRYQDIDQIGSCFKADMKCERERKEQESKKNQKVEFVPGGNQPGAVLPASKVSMPTAVAAGSGLPSGPTAVDNNIVRDGRQNKKSKWDKVDSDRRNHLPAGAQHSLSAAGAHTVILSAANAGTGYTAFAQQKRRETEEKKSSEKRLDRRS